MQDSLSLRINTQDTGFYSITQWLAANKITYQLGVPHGLDWIYDFTFETQEDFAVFILRYGDYAVQKTPAGTRF